MKSQLANWIHHGDAGIIGIVIIDVMEVRV